MGAVGWSPNYNLTDYKLQGSLDNANWFDIDTVTNNSANQTDRPTAPTKVRWARIYVTKGLRCNTNFASIVDLELYPADPTSAKLTGMTLSEGTLDPPFGSTTYTYTANAGYDTNSITVTATAEDSRATIKVNGVPAVSGQPSAPVSLNPGGTTTPIPVEVTPFIGDPQIYTINVTRASSPYLSDLQVLAGKKTLPFTEPFASNKLNYTIDWTGQPVITSVKVKPTAVDGSASITVNGFPVASGAQSDSIDITVTQTIPVVVRSSIGSDQKQYTINCARP
jgi:hypothetical protein